MNYDLADQIRDALADAWEKGRISALDIFPARFEDNPHRQDQP